MDSNKKNPDILESLFRQMPEEELPASFRLNVMQQIAKETVKVKKRNEWFGLAAVIVASLGMLGMAAAFLFRYRRNRLLRFYRCLVRATNACPRLPRRPTASSQ